MTDEERKAYQKEYYKANKAKYKAYKQSHKEERKAYQKAYYKAHEEELKEYREAHKAASKVYREAHKAASKVYREAHRDEYNAYNKSHQRQLYCCEEISKIENYELAKKDNFKGWDIHHRLETNNSDVNLSRKELIALGMYYNRPASELIFMTHSEHRSLHNMKRR